MISRFLIIAVVMIAINALIIYSGILGEVKIDLWWLNYAFLVPLTIAGLYTIKIRFRKSGKVTTIGKTYIFYTVIKMLLSILFLLPWLLNKDDSSKPMVIQFFSIFFPFLLVETILLVRLLNVKLGEKNKNEENQ